MCGIWLFLHKNSLNIQTKKILNDSFEKITNRGPDKSQFICLPSYGIAIGFHRLSIMDTTTNGDQPFIFEDEHKIIYLVANAEIYNFKELIEKYNLEPKSNSDCEVILLLYVKLGLDKMILELNGEFAFCICEITKSNKNVKIYAVRDHLGIRPLYVSGNKNQIVFSSEIKGIPQFDNLRKFVEHVQPRNIFTVSNSDPKLFDTTKSHNRTKSYRTYVDFKHINTTIFDTSHALEKIYNDLIKAVEIRMNADRSDVGCLLSGGLDSSLVASIASKISKSRGKKLHTFSIGLEGSTDEYYAKKASEYIDSIHTHITATTEDFISAVGNVIEATETYDITTVRASVGQYLVSKYVSENTNIKILLIGDVSDELTGGYLYFSKAPSKEEFNDETIRLLNNIHIYDVLRSDRCISTHGLEARVPFADKNLIHTYLSIDPILKLHNDKTNKRQEKWLLREAFRDKGYLPDEVLFRTKEAFSDGVSSKEKSWYKILQDYIEKLKQSDPIFKEFDELCRFDTPDASYYLYIFQKRFNIEINKHLVPYYWMPKWCDNVRDPSARVLDVYN